MGVGLRARALIQVKPARCPSPHPRQLWEDDSCDFRVAASPQQQALHALTSKLKRCHTSLASRWPYLPSMDQLWHTSDACAVSPSSSPTEKAYAATDFARNPAACLHLLAMAKTFSTKHICKS